MIKAPFLMKELKPVRPSREPLTKNYSLYSYALHLVGSVERENIWPKWCYRLEDSIRIEKWANGQSD